jgi:hypothetical protein
MKKTSKIKVILKLNSNDYSKFTINQFKNTLILNDTLKSFKFDYIIDNDNKNKLDIELIDDIVNTVINGRDSCIICQSYNNYEYDNIFKMTIEKFYSLMKKQSKLKHIIKVSCVEIDNEKMIDLFDDSGKFIYVYIESHEMNV